MLKYIYLMSLQIKCIIVVKYIFIFNITEFFINVTKKKNILQCVVFTFDFSLFLVCFFINLTQQKFINMTWEEIKPKISLPIFCMLTLCIFLTDILTDEKK